MIIEEEKMRDKLIVDGNIEVIIIDIEQTLTYGNLLEGIPSESYNAEKIYKEGRDVGFNEIYVIEPKQTRISYFSDEKYTIPKVTCRITVQSIENLKDASKDFSTLRIVWFQEDYAMPIDKDIINKLRKLPYQKLCGEYTY